MKSTQEEIDIFQKEFDDIMKNAPDFAQKTYSGEIDWDHGTDDNQRKSFPTNIDDIVDSFPQELKKKYDKIYEKFRGSIY
jgi:hypothetical protein